MIIKKSGFIHHVFFWLKNPESADDLKQLIEGLNQLSKVSTIRDFNIGKPAGTNRKVIDNTWSVSWLLLFDSFEDQESYQTDPIHLKFIEDCSHLWNKILIYDTVNL
jgi:hypothetical protein